MKKEIREKYDALCQEYLHEFCEKQGVFFAYWVDEVGKMACVMREVNGDQPIDYWLDMGDIFYDMNNNINPRDILDWYDNSGERSYSHWCIFMRQKNLTIG